MLSFNYLDIYITNKEALLRFQFDVIVEGLWPSEATTAVAAEDKGTRVLLVEENPSNKKATQCTDLISLRTFNE